MLLINGSDGVSMGFAQKIMPRDFKDVKKYLIDRLNGKKGNVKLLEPSVNNFNGTIIKDLETPNKYLISGIVRKIKDTEFLIEEIPYTYDLAEYLKVLNELEESKFIQKYADESDGENSLKFRVYISRANQEVCNIKAGDKNPDLSILLNKLKLIKPITENYTSIDENLKIFQANSIIELFERYYDVKLKYIEKRKNFLLDRYIYNNNINNSKKRFIELYIKGKLKINNVKKEELIEELEKLKFLKIDDSYDYLLKMPIYSLTFEKIEELKQAIEELENKIIDLKNSTAEQIWLNDLKKL